MRGVSVVRGQYHPPHVRGAALVFACTDDREVNARIAADARRAGALVNAADQPEDCDFFLPAVVADGEVVVAVGTGGASPSLAGGLKRKLKRALPRRIGAFASLLGRLREELRRRVSDPRERMRIMKVLSGEASYRAFRSGGPRAVRARMRALTNE
jgi:precorrin-2 dehydrogenase/sirohydrochlorin ferrochelatase